MWPPFSSEARTGYQLTLFAMLALLALEKNNISNKGKINTKY